MSAPTRYKNMNDEDWQKFGGALRWWANNEYRMMMEAQTVEEHAVAELGLHAAIDSLAKYFIVFENEKNGVLEVDEAILLAHNMVRREYASDLDEKIKL